MELVQRVTATLMFWIVTLFIAHTAFAHLL